MSAPVHYLADQLGNAMDFIASKPEIKALGHGTGLAFDIAMNAPMSTAYKMPHFAKDEEDRK